MATGSANTPHTFGKKIKHQSQDIKNLYSLVTVGKGIERISSGISSIVNTGSALSTLKTAGDTMIGAIGGITIGDNVGISSNCAISWALSVAADS